MAYKPQVIRNYKTGKQVNREPFIIEEDAFVDLQNAYVWRGRVKKKYGTWFVGRLAREFANAAAGTSGASPWSFNIFTITGIGAGETNRDIEVGSVVITIQAGPDIVFTDQGDGTLTSPTAGNSGTINYATGDVVLTHTAGAGITTVISFRYHPGLPVMGLPNKTVLQINEYELIAFDNKYAYLYSNVTNTFIETPSTLATTWSGSNSQLFWTENAYRALFATNDVAGLQGYNVNRFQNAAGGPPPTVDVRTTTANNLQVGDQVIFINLTGAAAANNGLRGVVSAIIAANEVTIQNLDSTATFPITWTNDAATTGIMIVANQNTSSGDGIRWYDDTTWINFNPVLTHTTALKGAGIIVFYRGRIVVLDTKEGNTLNTSATRYPQRARWSQNGTPFDIGPVPVGSGAGIDYQAWREDIPGKGGYIDCPTTEEIVGACFLRDTLIVGFEQSVWKLRYTNNEILPFIWERIDVELGCDSRFSGVKFDKQVMFVGTRGITSCDGVGVQRIDWLIPDEAFNFNNTNSGPERVYGIRDFEEQVVYWTFPNDNRSSLGVFPNRVMVYNYMEQAWGVLIDSFTCYGYWQPFYDLRWRDLSRVSWQQMQQPWQSPFGNNENQRVVAGNQVGYVHQVQQKVSNDPSLKVNAITVVANTPTRFNVVNHNLSTGEYIELSGFLGANASLNGLRLIVSVFDANNIDLYQWDSNTGASVIFTGGAGGSSYIGGGELTKIDNFRILTKKFNPFLDQAVSTRLKQVDFYVDGTAAGRFVVNLYVNDENTIVANPPGPDNPLSNRVETFANPYEQQEQEKYWHSLFDTVTGNLFQIELSYEEPEMNSADITNSAVVIHSIAPQAEVASRRLT